MLSVEAMPTAGLLCVLNLALAQADVSLLPYAAPGYTPELGFILSLGGSMTWNGDARRPNLPRSSLTLTLGGATVGAVLLQSRLSAYLHDDAVRFSALVDARDIPDHYFGVGFANGHTRVLGAETTALRRTWWNVEPTMLLRVDGRLYAGVVTQLSGSIARNVSAGVRADPTFQRFGETVVNTGVGVTVQYDTRDVPINAWKGMLLAATWTAFGRALGANSEWYSLTLDYRQYVQLFRPGSTLAWQVKYRAALGEVPWTEYTQVGTPFDLRAYRWGQYRDRTGVTALLEYRFMLPFPATSLWSHLGFATWVGVGAMGERPWPDVRELLPAVGVGLRVELQKRVTVRIDFGIGRDALAFYLNFLEVF